MREKPSIEKCLNYCNQRQVMPLMEWYVEDEGLSVRAASRKVEADTDGEVTADRARNVWSSRKGKQKSVLSKTLETSESNEAGLSMAGAQVLFGVFGCTHLSVKSFEALYALATEQHAANKSGKEIVEAAAEVLWELVPRPTDNPTVLNKTPNYTEPMQQDLSVEQAQEIFGIPGCTQLSHESFDSKTTSRRRRRRRSLWSRVKL